MSDTVILNDVANIPRVAEGGQSDTFAVAFRVDRILQTVFQTILKLECAKSLITLTLSSLPSLEIGHLTARLYELSSSDFTESGGHLNTQCEG